MTHLLSTLALTASLMLATLACGTPTEDLDTDERAGEAPRAVNRDTTPITVRDVLERPATFAGKPISISGEIVDVWSAQAFTLAGHQFLSNDTLLVVSDQPLQHLTGAAATIPTRGDIVEVSGAIRLIGMQEIKRQFGLELRPGVANLATAKGPVFVAERVTQTR